MSAREQLSKLMNEWAPKSDLLIKRYCTKHFGIPQLQQIAIFHKSHKKCYIILWGELNLLLIFPVQITQKNLNMFFLALADCPDVSFKFMFWSAGDEKLRTRFIEQTFCNSAQCAITKLLDWFFCNIKKYVCFPMSPECLKQSSAGILRLLNS